MDAGIRRHEVQGFVQDSESFLEPALLEERSSHVIVSKTDLHRDLVLQVLSVHEFGSAL